MELLSLLFGIIVGMFLTIGDGMAAECRKKYGQEVGRLAWMVMVAGPALFAMYHNRDVGLVAAIVGAVLFYSMHLQALLEARKPSVSLSKEEAKV